MALHKKPLHALEHFLPTGSFELVMPYLNKYHIKLKITKARTTKYGDYRPAHAGKAHQISVNGNLNPYHFLLTLVHEIAHLVAFEDYGFKINPHGDEWKHTYQMLMLPFLKTTIFPGELLNEVKKAMQNVKSSSCYDANLAIALRKYDDKPIGTMVQDLAPGAIFSTSDKRNFKLLQKRRTRYEAKEIGTDKIYLFPALYEVEKL